LTKAETPIFLRFVDCLLQKSAVFKVGFLFDVFLDGMDGVSSTSAVNFCVVLKYRKKGKLFTKVMPNFKM
jgi:hypothetical protein